MTDKMELGARSLQRGLAQLNVATNARVPLLVLAGSLFVAGTVTLVIETRRIGRTLRP